MLLMIERDIRGGMWHILFIYIWKLMANIWKIIMKIKNLHKYWDVNNICEWAMSQKLPVNNFKWVGERSQFNEDFLKSYSDDSDEGYFLEVDGQYLENLLNLNRDLPFLPERSYSKVVW